MKNYFIALNPSHENTAWSKAAEDVEFFLSQMGFHPIPVQRFLAGMESCLAETLPADEDGILLLQYPKILFEDFNFDWFLHCMRVHFPQYRLVALIHDLDSIRFGDFFTTGRIAEISTLNQFDFLIAVNDSMKTVLERHGALPRIYSMSLFDYTLKSGCRRVRHKTPTIAFAGNLKYEAFLYQLDKIDWKGTVLHLYGPNLNTQKWKPSAGCRFCGEFPPDELPDAVTDSFGLCWEGNSLDGCHGKIAEYLKYTNSHKTSFYLALGLPVILCEQMPTAAFIKRKHAGIVISSLHELPDAVNSLSEEDYQGLHKNCLRLSHKLRHGCFLGNVILQVMRDMQNCSSSA
ncbi:hypothetical protein [Caproicibacterium sp. XB2]|uniref:hypothetical protein n=1 Tax=Caproicibacterium sp. XB2 TaxID=3388458 RepID=UPI00384ECFB5